MIDTDSHITVVTETWLQDGEQLEQREKELLQENGIGMICLNRDPNANGVSYGGVAVLWQESKINFRQVTFKNQDRFEVLVAAGAREERWWS